MARIEQRLKLVDDSVPVVTNQGYFGKTGGPFYAPGRFNVDDTIHVKKAWLVSGHQQAEWFTKDTIQRAIEQTTN